MRPQRATRRSARRRRTSPSATGEPVEVEITRLGAQGDGIAETVTGVLNVPLTVPNERVLVRPPQARGAGRVAELVEILRPGPDRAPPPCPHFGGCGGCTLQHLRDTAYAAWKVSRLTASLEREGLVGYDLAALVRTPAAERRRATFAAWHNGATVTLGFTARRGHDVVDVPECRVLHPRLRDALPGLGRLLTGVLAPGARADVAVALLDGGLDVVIEVPRPPDLRQRQQLARDAETLDLARLSWRPRADAEAEPIVRRRPAGVRFAGRPAEAESAGVFVEVPPGGFLQPCTTGEAALVATVGDALAGARAVVDLFAGAGTFTLSLALGGARARRVHAVDADRPALAALALAARQVPAEVSTEARDLYRRPLLPAELDRFDGVVIDPPRAGAVTQSAQLARSRVPLVVYVSCNPDSFARDARILTDGGFRLQQVLPVDQFLWSAHLEIAGTFLR